MIIFDTKNNNDGKSIGMLYLSVMDAEYLFDKYGKDVLAKKIPLDYLDYFEEAIKDRENERIFSIEHYAILSIGIDTEKDKEILYLLQEERDILYTKSELSNMDIKDIDKLLKDLEEQINNPESLNLEELYRIRSYKMVKYVNEHLKMMQECIDVMYTTEGTNARLIYREIEEILIAIGLSKYIYESDFFSLSQLKKIKAD